jgi:hypothetical protein
VDQGRGSQGPDLTTSTPGADPAPASPSRRRRFRLPFGTALIWHIVSLAVGGFFLMYVSRSQWFFGDEWDFLADRSATIGDHGLFVPHNEHWSTTPILIYGALFRAFGLTSYAPYMAVLVVAHLAVVHLMWRVMCRGGVVPRVATVVCAAFIPFGPGADNLLWAFQIGFVGSVALGLAAIIVADHPRPFGGRDLAFWGTSVAGLTFSGITIPLVGAASVLAWLRRGFKSFLVAVSVPAAVYLLWLLTFGRRGLGEIEPVTADSLGLIPEFIWRGARAILALGTATPLTGLFLLALTAVALVLRRSRGAELPHAALAAAIGQALLLVMVAVGRTPFGLETAEATRYVYIGGALLLPLMTVGLSDLLGRRFVGVILIALLAAPWATYNARVLIHRAELQADRERLIREQMVAAGTLFDGSAILRSRVDPVYSRDLHLPELERLLPTFPDGATSSPEGVVRAALALQVSMARSAEFGVSPPLPDVRAFDASFVPLSTGCVRATPAGASSRLLIPVGPPWSLELTGASAMEPELLLSAGGIRPDYRIRPELDAGVPRYLNVVVDADLVGESTLIVRFDGGITVCPVDAATG